ncbi:MAG: DUF2383 domain-containing protein [Sandaracinaceae bacterium]
MQTIKPSYVDTRRYELQHSDVDQLCSFARGELSAVETYAQAIQKLSENPAVVSTLLKLQRSHHDRAQELRRYVIDLGGEPPESSGPWGSFAKLVEKGATLIGEKAAISALEEGEDHGLADYRRDLPQLSPQVRRYVEERILPEQQRSHHALSQLRSDISRS